MRAPWNYARKGVRMPNDSLTAVIPQRPYGRYSINHSGWYPGKLSAGCLGANAMNAPICSSDSPEGHQGVRSFARGIRSEVHVDHLSIDDVDLGFLDGGPTEGVAARRNSNKFVLS